MRHLLDHRGAVREGLVARVIWLFIFVAAVPVLAQGGGGPKEKIYRLAAGDPSGIYHKCAIMIAQAMEKNGLNIQVIPTSGSDENLRRLVAGEADLCLAQSDAVAHIKQDGNASTKIPESSICMVSPLYTEVVHILVRNPLYVHRLMDFKGKRIFVGVEGSGTERNAVAIMEAAGISSSDVTLYNGNLTEMVKAFQNGDVDAGFLTSGYPSVAVKTLLETRQARLFEPDSDLLTRLVDGKFGFVITTIPIGTYKEMDESISTPSVPALLLADKRMDEEAVYLLAKAIMDVFQNEPLTSARAKTLLTTTINSNSGVAPFHLGAKMYYEGKGFFVAGRLQKLALYVLIPAGIIFTGIFVIIRRRKLFHYFANRPVIRAAFFLIVVLFSGAVVMYYAEHRVNENYGGFFISIWSTLCNWINFGAKEPYTLVGKTTSIAMTIIGLGGITWLTGQIASVFIEKKLRNH